MKLPKDPENWTGWHAEKALKIAWKKFAEYEAKVDFDKPQEVQDKLYYPYFKARQEAIQVCHYTQWKTDEAEALP